MERQPSEGMELCVSGVNLGFDNPSMRMEEDGDNLEGVLRYMPSNEEAGQSEGSTSTSNEVMPRFRSIQALYEATDPIEEECLISFEEPTTYSKASEDEAWRKAMEEEITSIEKNDTWKLVKAPKSCKPIGVKWVYKLKKNPLGEIVKHKARLVVKGYRQRYGIDYEEVFAPVARFESIRILIALAAQECWSLHHLDVKSAFLNGEIKEEIYVSQPEGYVKEGKEEWVLKLNKALYSLKQEPRAWNAKLDDTLKSIGFVKSKNDQGVYYLNSNQDKVIVGVYVDDLIITGASEAKVKEFKKTMMKIFEMTDLGLLSSYLGIEVHQGKSQITLSQRPYAAHIFESFQMVECNPTNTPMEAQLKLKKEGGGRSVDATLYRSLIESLRYLLHTRPDMTYSVSILSRYMVNPTSDHWIAAKRVLRYLKGTIDFGLVYVKGVKNLNVIGYSDSDFAGDVEDRKSTSGQIFFLGGLPITWNSLKQKVVALSSCEAEYIAITSAICQGVWIARLVMEVMGVKLEAVKIMVDNQSAIMLSKTSAHHNRTKHIDTRYHFIRDCIEDGRVIIEHVKTEDQLADILTKSLGRVKFVELSAKIGVKKPWDMKKLKEENVGVEFLPPPTSHASST